MPGIARKVLICAALEGLIIQPLSAKGQRPFQPVRVKYGDSAISAVPRDQVPDVPGEGSYLEAFGVIGLITVSKLSYLITITRRQQVAHVFGHPVYVVTGVAITPCSSKNDADESIRRTTTAARKQAAEDADDSLDSTDDEVEAGGSIHDEIDDATSEGGMSRPDSPKSSVVEDVMRHRGSYGRFAQRWFSKSGWTLDQRRTLGLSVPSSGPPGNTTFDPSRVAKIPLQEDVKEQNRVTDLLPKLLRTMQVFFGSSKSFYFSYDIDLTRSLAQNAFYPEGAKPLHTSVDSQFFWNRHILQPFTSTGQDAICLPLIQGFVGQTSFVADKDPPQRDENASDSLEMSNLSLNESASASPRSGSAPQSRGLRSSEKEYLVTLISRRSTQRAGLRYLRRGINEEGFSANMVETEQILSSPNWDNSSAVYSFLQIRGSIPLFFTQTAYALKPVPMIQHSEDTNYQACKRHFERLHQQYGSLQIVSLVEKQGIEEPIGTQYLKSIERFNEEHDEDKRIPFEWFDFHQACRGMKFENVNQLLSKLKGELVVLGSTIQTDGNITYKQRGVLRTNCMDCLDRTNVCQSSFAKHMLDKQLKQEGVDMSAQLDQETSWFNTIWADNGDAVSKQYASTAAMKGDYTRTRKRDYRGALNDLGLSLARFYNGMVNDYFSQAAMDFLLGNVTEKVFDEFESDMMTKDPAISVAKMRQRAVELCQKRVVADMREELHGGWVLLSPDTLKAWAKAEVVLLLTDAALYICRFDWDLEKVSSFERVHLSNVTHIKFGTYITSTISPAQMDEMKNVGFVVSYQPGKSNTRRTNTRTLSSKGDFTPITDAESVAAAHQQGLLGFLSPKPKAPSIRKLSFKAPYVDSASAVGFSGPQQTELQQVVTICAEIERLAQEAQFVEDADKESKSIVENGDIVSLQEAKRNTGILEQLGHSIKKLVWA